jgi:hypothetical protein
MNELIFQTIVFSSTTLLSVIGVFIYFKNNQSTVPYTVTEVLGNKLYLKAEEPTLAIENNVNTRTELAFLNTSIQHFKTQIEEKPEITNLVVSSNVDLNSYLSLKGNTMISNLLLIHVEYDIGQITKCFSRLYSNEDLFEFKISAFNKCIKGSMCL